MLQLSLHTRAHHLLALVLGLTALGGSAAGILRGVLASRARATTDRVALERAAHLQGDDALYQHRLGQWEQFSLTAGDPQRALVHYRRATELNPYESEYWLDLADALLLHGDTAEAVAAIAKAVQVDPHTPQTLWRVGNFWLRTAEPARAFPYFRQGLLADPLYTALVVQASQRTFPDPEMALRDVLPPQPVYWLAYLRELVREGEAQSPAAARVWEQLVKRGQPLEAQEVFFYLDFLIDTRQLPQAVKAWREMQRLHWLPAETGAAPAASGELLYNPALRLPPSNGGFDWRIESAPHVSVLLGPGRQGEQPPAIVIRFSGEDNLHYRNFFQYVVVEPNRRYRFQAWVSTEGITTESGPRLEVADASDPGRGVVQSPSLVGTTDWVREEVEFVTGPQARLLRVGIVRLPSRRLGNTIRGSVRATEFSLREVGRGS